MVKHKGKRVWIGLFRCNYVCNYQCKWWMGETRWKSGTDDNSTILWADTLGEPIIPLCDSHVEVWAQKSPHQTDQTQPKSFSKPVRPPLQETVCIFAVGEKTTINKPPQKSAEYALKKYSNCTTAIKTCQNPDGKQWQVGSSCLSSTSSAVWNV